MNGKTRCRFNVFVGLLQKADGPNSLGPAIEDIVAHVPDYGGCLDTIIHM